MLRKTFLVLISSKVCFQDLIIIGIESTRIIDDADPVFAQAAMIKIEMLSGLTQMGKSTDSS